MKPKRNGLAICLIFSIVALAAAKQVAARFQTDELEIVRVFIFAGQSNMVGSDSNVKDINRFPPFTGLNQPQDKILFSCSIGREDKLASRGWVPLQPVGGDWNPDDPQGFKLYSEASLSRHLATSSR